MRRLRSGVQAGARALARPLVAAALLGGVLAVPLAEPAAAATIRAFSIRYQADINGAVDLFGNTLMTCGTSAACATAQATTGANNDFSMQAIDADGSAYPTTNSSAAVVTIPTGATVRFAGLYWMGYSSNSARNQVKLRRPGDTAYTTVTASQLDADGTAYQGFADITAQVSAAGGGEYWVGDARFSTGVNLAAGWSIVVVWEQSTQPLRNITVFDGYGVVQNSPASDRTMSIPLSGFLTPISGTVNAEVGVMAMEGDTTFTGDAFLLNSTPLSNSLNPADNFFNSSITTAGTYDSGRTPSFNNNLGIDVDEVDASGILPNSSTSATVKLTTSGDAYYPGMVTTQIDLYSPQFPAITKSVVDLNGGEVRPGDVLEYTIATTNTGLDPAQSSVMTDVLPANTTYVPGSIRITAGANTGTKTDATGDDQGEYVAGQRKVVVRVGSGATSSAGGTIAPNASTTVKFRVTVDTAAAAGSGSTISNQYTLDYVAATLNRPFQFNSNLASVTVPPLADMSITKSVSASPLLAGSTATYTLTATNNGPGTAQDVTITDVLPAGVTVTSTTPASGTGTPNCTTGSGVVCSFGAVTAGSTVTATVNVSVSSAIASGTLLTNSADVTTSVTDLVPGNNTATVSSLVQTFADLAVTKSVSPTTLTAGSTATYTITVVNNGPSTATAPVITDLLPAGLTVNGGLTVDGVAPSPGTCTTTTIVTCQLAAMASGTTTVLTIPVAVNPGLGTGAVLGNLVSVSSSNYDPTLTNNSYLLTSNVNNVADVSITKTIVTDPVVPGLPVSFHIVVTNAGPSTANGVVVTDPIGTFTATSAISSLGSCSTGPTVTCNIGMLTPGSSAAIDITASSPPSLTDGSTVSNTATVSATNDTSTGNNSATDTAPVDANAVLSIVKTGTPNPVSAGGTVTYTVTVSNAGPSTATNVVVTDSLPSTAPNALSFVSAGSSAECTASGSVVTCAPTPAVSLPPGVGRTYTIVASVPANSTGNFTNTAQATSPQAQTVTASAGTSVSPRADLQVTKSTVAATAAGQQATFLLAVSNAGPNAATNVSVTDSLPTGFHPASVTSDDPAVSCTSTATSANCTRATLANGSSFTVTVVADVDPDLAATTYTNSATVGASGPIDPSTANNTATSTIDISRAADLVAAKSGPAARDAGTSTSFTLSATNAGPSTADSVTVSDLLPSGMTFVPGASSSACSAVGQQVTCTASGSLAPGAQATFTVGVAIAANVSPGSVTNTAVVHTTTPDPVPANDSASATLDITTQASLQVSKEVVTDPVVAGRPIEWTVTITNNGPSDAQATTFSDTAPSGVAFTGATASNAATCTTTTASAASCSLGVLAAGDSVTVSLSGDIATSVPVGATITNTASASSPTDPTANTASASATVTTSADLQVTKRVSPDPVAAGDPLTWVIEVSNLGPSDAQSVSLTDLLPAGVTFQSSSASTGTCSGTTTVSCSLGTLAYAATATVTIVGVTDASLASGSTITNSATASSSTPDPVSANDTGSVDVTLSASADLQITKTPDSSSAIAGARASWTINVVQAGPSYGRSVVVTDPLPAGLTNVTASSTVGTCSAGATVTCTLGDLAPGTVVTITVEADVPAATPSGSTLTNTATVSATSTDPVASNDAATATMNVTAVADLRATKTASPSPVNAGQRITWTVAVTNDGPSDSQGVTITDPLPSGASLVSASWTAGGAPTNCTSTGTTVNCPVGTLAAGTTATATITATVAASYTAATIGNTATIDATTLQPDASPFTVSSSTPVATPSDVSVTKTGPATASVGTDVTWTISVVNSGPAVARAVTVGDVIPSGVTLVSATPSVGACTSGATVSCALGDLAVSATPVTVTLVGTVAPGYTAATVTNTATVTQTNIDPIIANNISSAVSSTRAAADLVVTKAGPSGPITAGQTISWTITVDNNGPAVSRSVTVSDPLPAEIDPATVTATSSTGTCTTGTTVSCVLGDVAPSDAPITITLTGTVLAGSTATSTSNTATVSALTADDVPANNSATASTSLTTSADLAVTKVLDTVAPTAGLPVQWTVTVTNTGPSTARAVHLTDTPPFALSYLTSTVGTCTLSPAADCDLGDLPAGASATITVQATIPSTFTGSMTNVAHATTSTSDPVTANNTATRTDPVATSADLRVVKTSSPQDTVAGGVLDYTLTVDNLGPSVGRTPTVTDTLPSGFVPAAGVPSTSPITGSGYSCSISAARVLTCTLTDLAVTEARTIAIPGSISPANVSPFTNTASVSSPTSDPVPANNDSSASNDPTVIADLAVDKTLLTADPVAGQPIRWQITVTNNGPSSASAGPGDIVVSDTAPSGVTFTPASAVVSTTGGAACAATSTAVDCSIADLAPSASFTVVLEGNVSPDQPAGPLSNTALLTAGTAFDPTAENDTDTVVATVRREAVLSVTKTPSVTTTSAGTNVVWTVTVANAGPSSAEDVTISDPLPAGLTYVASASSATCSATGNLVGCAATSTLAAGASTSFTIVTAVDPALDPTTITNSASAASTTPNTATPGSGTVTTTRESTAVITKTADPTSAAAGGDAIWTITVRNVGPSTLIAPVVHDTLDPNLSFVAAVPSSGSCSYAAPDVTCTLADLAVGETATVTLSATVAPSTPAGPLGNTATLTAGSTLTPTSVLSASAPVTITTSADLTIAKTATDSPFVPGQPISWNLVVGNAGPSDAAGVVVADTAPPGVLFTSADSATLTGCQVTGGGTGVSCAAGTVAAGSSHTITVTGVLDADYISAQVANTATVTADTSDPAGPNASTAITTTRPNADLSIAKAGPAGPVLAGETATWTVTVTSSGPSVARNVVVTDQLPSVLDPASISLSVSPTTAGTCLPGTSVECDLGDVVPNGTPTVITITGTIRADVTDPDMTNEAAVATTTADDDQTDNTASVTTPLASSADLTLTKTLVTAAPTAGLAATWTVTVTNRGPSVARSVSVTDTPPFPLSALTTTVGTCDAGTGVCDLGDLPPLAVVTITGTGTIPADWAAPDMTNAAQVTSTTADANDTNNSFSLTSPVATSADLSITKTASDPTAISGTALDYTITVANAGPSDALTPLVSDTLPSAFVPSGTSFTGTGYSCTITGADLVCGLTTNLGVGGSVVIAVPGSVTAGNTASFTNTASVTSATHDPTAADNSATTLNDPNIVADLAVSKRVLTTDPVAGQPIRYELTFTNLGPSTASPGAGVVEVADLAPVGTSFDPASAVVSTAGPSAVTCAPSADEVTCSVDSVAVGDVYTVVLEALIDPAFAGASITNTATLTRGVEADPTISNNSATAVATVRREAALSATKSVSPAGVHAGERATWTVTVTNAGPSTATSVAISDTLDDALAYVDADSSPSCSAVGQLVTCAGGTLAVGESATFTIATDVDPATPAGTIPNTVTSSTATPGSAGTASASLTVTRQAVPVVTKRAITDPVVAGENMTWEITVTNAGPSSLEAPHIADTIDTALLDFVSATPTSGSCTFTSPSLSCDLDPVAPGATETIMVTTLVRPTAPAGALANTATLTTPTPTGPASVLTATAAPMITTSADVVVTKTAVTDPVVAGSPVSWDVTVRNDGPSDAQSVVVADPAPAGITWTAATSVTAPSACIVTAATVTCSLATLPLGVSHTFRLTGTLAADASASSLTNIASATTSTPDPVTPNTDQVTVPVTTSADVSIVKTGPAGPVVAGTSATWTLTVHNAGPSDAAGVIATDTLPAEIDPATVSVTPSAGCLAGATVSCALGTLASGATVTLTITGTVLPDAVADDTAPPSMVNTASVATTTADLAPANDTASTTTPLVGSADVTITKQLDTATAVAGQPVQWTITVHNAGPSTANAVHVADTAPFPLTSMSATVGTCTAATASCDLGDLAAGQTVTITAAGTVPAAFVSGTSGTMTNQATVSSTTPDPDTANTAVASDAVATSADLSITKTSSDPQATSGTPLTYTLTVTNGGSSVSRAPVVTDSLPARFVPTAGVPSAGPITGTGFVCTIDAARLLTCTLSDLAPSALVQITIAGAIDASSTTPFSNTASVDSAITPDPQPANDSATVINDPAVVADLAITKRILTAAPVAGQPIQYELTITNNGPSTASAGAGDIAVTDPAPAGTTMSSVVSADPALTCTVTSAQATCTTPELAVGQTMTAVFEGVIGATRVAGPLSNTATVGSPDLDPAPSNNSSTATADVGRQAALTVTKSADVATVVAGNRVTWTVTVINAGPSTATATSVSDTLPAGFSLVAAQSSTSCSAAGADVTCSAGTLAVGASATFTLVTEVDPAHAAGVVTNTATASSTTPFTVTPAGADVTVERLALASVTKSAAVDPVTAGTTATWTITVTNDGPSTIEAPVVTDVLDPLLGFVSAVPEAGTCGEAAGTLTCTLPDLAPGESLHITVTTDVSPAAADGSTLPNTATLTSTTPLDPASTPSATASPLVEATADLSVTKTPVVNPAVPGEPVEWLITVRNDGPSDAQSVVVDDPAPAGVTWTAAAADPADPAASCTVAASVSCTVSTLAAGGEVTFRVTGSLDPSVTASPLTNTATATAATTDPGGPASATSAIAVTPIADLAIAKSRTPNDAVAAGSPITWTVDIVNNGPSTALDVVWNDTLPAAIDPTTVTVTETATGTTAGCTAGATVTCPIAAVLPGATVTYTLTGTVRADVTAPTLTNTAQVAGSTPDPTAANDSSTLTSPLTTAADVVVTKVLDTTASVAGQPIQWTVHVVNNGPSVARAVTVNDPAPFPLESATPDQGTCDVTGVSCALGDLLVGQGVDVVLVGVVPADWVASAAVAPATSASVTNSVSVTSTTPDATDPTSPNTASVTGDVASSADLAIVKSVSDPLAISGQPMAYTLTITNLGTSTAVAPSVADTEKTSRRWSAVFTASSRVPSGVSSSGCTCGLSQFGHRFCARASGAASSTTTTIRNRRALIAFSPPVDDVTGPGQRRGNAPG